MTTISQLLEIQDNVEQMTKRMNGVNPLSNIKSSFAVIGVRCNSDKSIGRRKLKPHQIYYLLEGYSIDEEPYVSEQRINLEHLYDDYIVFDVIDKPNIQISAIVGQNGSGKSSLVEFIMRLINNFAACTFGELKTGPAAERLHYIYGVEGDLWFVMDGFIHQLHVDDNHVSLSILQNLNSKKEIENGTIIDININKGVLSALGKEERRRLYEMFFYTLVSNFSLYAYNTLDYRNEYDDNAKCQLIEADHPDQKFDEEHRCWLHGLFHKNDGYQTPMVITPYRYEGNMDINCENGLAIERLITLLIKNDSLRLLNGHLYADSISLDVDLKRDYGYTKIVKSVGLKQLKRSGYKNLRADIVSAWSLKLELDLTSFSHKPLYDRAIDYLVYKTLKIASYYKHHNEPFELLSMVEDKYNPDLIIEMVDSEASDLSHITRKIHQTLGYILYDSYSEYFSSGRLASSIRFEDIDSDWRKKVYAKYQKSPDFLRSSLKAEIATQALVPPPFLSYDINLYDGSNSAIVIGFETLSSGEKQLIYAVSSILYHLSNLNSVRDDKSAPYRIPYRNIFMILEEVELYFHPELQQKFVKYLLDGMNQMDLGYIRGVHLLLITHSPYVLSDIPNENVLALNKDGRPSERKLRTFCANIHEMLKDSFFMSEGTQGAFAQWEIGHLMACLQVHRIFRSDFRNNIEKKDIFRNRISELIENIRTNKDGVYGFLGRYLNAEKVNSENHFSYEDFCLDFSEHNLTKRIRVIDEPLIRNILLKEIDNVFAISEEDLKRRRISELEQEIKKLKGE